MNREIMDCKDEFKALWIATEKPSQGLEESESVPT